MQTYMSLGDSWETFWLYEMNGPGAAARVEALFKTVVSVK
jgi:hypothetical protein